MEFLTKFASVFWGICFRWMIDTEIKLLVYLEPSGFSFDENARTLKYGNPHCIAHCITSGNRLGVLVVKKAVKVLDFEFNVWVSPLGLIT